jgi:hypothetical protein
MGYQRKKEIETGGDTENDMAKNHPTRYSGGRMMTYSDIG